MEAFCKVRCCWSCVKGCRIVAIDKRDARRCSEGAGNVAPGAYFSQRSRGCCRLGEIVVGLSAGYVGEATSGQ